MKYTWRETIEAFLIAVVVEAIVFAAIGAFIFTVSVWSMIGMGG